MRNAVFALALLFVIGRPASFAQGSLVQIYIVQHGETSTSSADPSAIPLSAAGHQRAALLSPTFRDIQLTNLIASHTFRTRQTLEPLARERSLSIAQYPAPGSTLNGSVVNDQLTRQAAVEPVAGAMLALPAGSVVLAALNSDNIFAVLNRLGIPVRAGCAAHERCVPCLNNTCFPPPPPDRLWYLVIPAGRAEPLVFTELRYGAGWTPVKQ